MMCSNGNALCEIPSGLVADCRGAQASTSDMKAYGTSKLMTIMSNIEMVRRLKGSGIDSFICQPGMSSTPVYGKTDKSHVMANVLDAAQKVLGQTEERGAVPLLYAATAPEMSGKLCARHDLAAALAFTMYVAILPLSVSDQHPCQAAVKHVARFTMPNPHI